MIGRPGKDVKEGTEPLTEFPAPVTILSRHLDPALDKPAGKASDGAPRYARCSGMVQNDDPR